MSLWWLQPGWDQATCSNCGARIAPEGDPDWGVCWGCMEQQRHHEELEQQQQREWEAQEAERFYRDHPHG